MTIAEACLLIAGLMPYLAAGLAKSHPSYDNRAPREWLARQVGWRGRANAAQANAFEAFPLFAACVLLAEWRHAPQALVNGLAAAFIAARIAYLGCYVADWPQLRSVLWVVGIGLVIAIYATAGYAPV